LWLYSKFFSKPNGSGPPPVQSKLAFSSKSTPSEPTNGSRPAKSEDVQEDVDMEEPERVAHKAEKPEDLEEKVKQDPTLPESSTASKKRPRAKEEVRKEGKQEKKEATVKDEPKEEDSDDEPVVKRSRRNGAQAESKPTSKSVKKEEVKVKDEPLSSQPTTNGSAKKSAASKEASDIDDKPEVPKAASASEEDTASEIDEADEEHDEDEKPEVIQKAREKVQTLLKSKDKEPYPDWKPGEHVPYAALCTTFSLIEMTTKRLIMISHCSQFLRQVLRLTPDDLLPTVLLMIGKLAAEYEGIELGIGESLIMKAIGETTGRNLQVIKQDQKEIGDLGLVAVKSKSKQPTMFKPKPLTVRSVLKGLREIATMTGNGAQGRKVDSIKKLLSAADGHMSGSVDITKDKGGPSEAKYIVRFLEGKLRLGLAEKTVLTSLAQAMVCHEIMSKSGKVPSTEQMAQGESVLKTVFSELPSYDVIIPAVLQHGIFNLRENCKLQPGVPLKPMLAKPTKSITEVLDRFENQTFTCEYKYDGERAQIHYVSKDSDTAFRKTVPDSTKGINNGLAAIFSRNSEDLSKKYPDILAKLQTWVKEDTKSFVLDCETVAWDVVEKKVLPFQQLMTRKKKDVKTEDIKVKVCVFAFDLLYLNGEALVSKSLRERRELLHTAFTPAEGEFAFATFMVGREIDEIQQFLDESVKASCEGLMVKMLDGEESGYEPSKRSRNWLKVCPTLFLSPVPPPHIRERIHPTHICFANAQQVKKDYLTGIGDSLDLVVLGAYHGKGKRTSWYGAFLLACYNSGSDTYETICNIGTGFSEEVLKDLHAQLSSIVIERPKPFYRHSDVPAHQPDVWFEPRYVWEVKTADLTLSPRYKAGSREGVDPAERGISLRFPRFIKVRDDKRPDGATSSRQVAELYRKQESVARSKGPAVDDDFEY
jgi:DNA ligase-1